MPRLVYNITAENDGARVDHFLRVVSGVSRRVIVSLKHRPDGLLRNGEHIRTIDLLHAGDRLELNLPEITKRLPLSETAVPLLYEDEDVLVYDKPAGMPVHQSGGHIYGTLASVYAATAGADNVFRPVNRLDKDTTGAIVIARHQVAAGKLWKAVHKRYIAVVTGVPRPAHGIIDLPIEREAPYERRRVVTPDGQPAKTEYTVLAAAPDGRCALVGFILRTGRTHQIRVHMADFGHPLLGDELYGGALDEIPRQALHCAAVRFPQPMTGEGITVTAPLPEDMRALLDAMGIAWAQPLADYLAGIEEPQ